MCIIGVKIVCNMIISTDLYRLKDAMSPGPEMKRFE